MPVSTLGMLVPFGSCPVSQTSLLIARERFLKDDRVRGTAERSIFNVRDAADRLG